MGARRRSRWRAPLGVLALGACSALAACLDLGNLGGGGGETVPPRTDGDATADAASGADTGAADAPCTADPPDPRYVSDAIDVVAGFGMACALRENGTVTCWGSLPSGASWPGTVTGIGPRVIDGVTDATRIAAGLGHVCVLGSASGLRCWGDNSAGQLGGGPAAAANPGVVPVVDSSAIPLVGVTDMAAGFNHTCALVQGGAVACWGSNVAGQLGSASAGASTTYAVPVNTLGGGAIQITAGDAASCALRMVSGSSLIECWGGDGSGQLGVDLDGGNAQTPVIFPFASSGAAAPARLSGGFRNTCVVDVAGNVYCSGANPYGALGSLGVGASRISPSPVQGLADGQTRAFSANSLHGCAIRQDGTLQCLGSNTAGQLGQGTADATAHPVPAPVRMADGSPLGNVIAVTTGGYTLDGFTCAVSARRCARSGTVYCWGSNGFGELGAGTTASSYPAPVPHP